MVRHPRQKQTPSSYSGQVHLATASYLPDVKCVFFCFLLVFPVLYSCYILEWKNLENAPESKLLL